MDEINIDQALDMISSKLHVSKEIETELLAEIRTHLEEAVAYSRSKGGDEQDALRKAVEKFGMDEVGSQLEEVHAGRESIEAIAATALPILLALILRWLAFVPEGSYQAWNQLLVQPAFWTVALTALFVPGILFRRWGFALIGWGVFWLITIIFVTFPHAQNW